MMQRPNIRETVDALRFVGGLLGETIAYQLDGRFYFPVAEGWFVAISPDSAGRFRVEACYGATVVGRLWARSEDRDRLAGLILALRDEARALAH